MPPLDKFMKGVMKMPLAWRLWLLLLVAANLFVPLFHIERLEAQIVLIAMLASMAFMIVLTAISGFTRILGFGHIFWVPLLYFLLIRVGQIPAGDFFGFWIRAVIILNGISLVIDAADVIRYIAGDRKDAFQER